MSISSVRGQIETRLVTITGLNVHKQIPDAVGKLPVAIVSNAGVNYEVSLGTGTMEINFKILLLVGERDSATAHASLDEYLEKTGTKSILAALRGGAVGDFVRLFRAENAGFISYRNNTYIGAEFILVVVDSN
jgi:hypothetical protein